MLKKATITLLYAILVHVANGQIIARSTVGAIGSSMQGNGVLIQQTAGQPSATTYSGGESNSGIRQGFHQPFFYETEINQLNAVIYPNPNNGQFSFQVDLPGGTVFNYVLTDQAGRKVFEQVGEGSVLIPVTIDNPSTGMYHLRISYETYVSSFKINVIE